MAYDFQLKYTLHAESPLIHFQYDTDGATLRASEVKPKLDRFLKKRADSEKRNWKEWVNKKHESAFDYKMEIKPINEKKPICIKLGERGGPYEIYYGNMSKDENPREICAIRKDAILTITCFNAELRDFINNNIDRFFIVTNFGRMSGKGFGSYTVSNKHQAVQKMERFGNKFKYTKTEIAKILKEEYGAKVCCSFPGGGENCVFKRIKIIYSLMKSGINFRGYQRSLLFLYIKELELGIDNEKASLKRNKIAPAVSKDHNRMSKYHEPEYDESKRRYVRALLGVGDKIRFKNEPNNNRSTFTEVTISDSRGEKHPEAIARFPSPVLFKIIDDTVYYVARPIDPSISSIYGTKFDFSNKNSKNIHNECVRGSIDIPIPLEEEIKPKNTDLSFLDSFLLYSMKKMNSKSDYDKSGRYLLDIFEDTKGVRIERV